MVLEADKLICVRGERTLFRDVSFTLAPGQLLHVAGANGTGKTSLLRILCGLGMADAGEVRWRGMPIRASREDYAHHLVYLGHSHALKDDLSATENLLAACMLAGRPVTPGAARDALTEFGLAQCAHLPVRALSQGQKRRSGLARLALSQAAPLWILDEPFSALDVHAVRFLEGLILGHAERGGSVIFTTHQDAAITARAAQRIELNVLVESSC